MRTGRDERLRRLDELLRDEGLAGARARAAGHTGDIAVVAGDVTPLRIRALADRIRGMGFRYVTLELESEHT